MIAALRTLKWIYPLATDGDIAVINLESARQQSWSRFWQAPQRPGIAEYIVEQEQLAAQFLGDLTALDRLETLVESTRSCGRRIDANCADPCAGRVDGASLRRSEGPSRTSRGPRALPADIERLTLSIDQACGTRSRSGARSSATDGRGVRPFGGSGAARLVARGSRRIR